MPVPLIRLFLLKIFPEPCSVSSSLPSLSRRSLTGPARPPSRAPRAAGPGPGPPAPPPGGCNVDIRFLPSLRCHRTLDRFTDQSKYRKWRAPTAQENCDIADEWRHSELESLPAVPTAALMPLCTWAMNGLFSPPTSYKPLNESAPCRCSPPLEPS